MQTKAVYAYLSGVAPQANVRLDWLDGVVIEGDNISLKCQSSVSDLVFMRWFVDTTDNIRQEIYYYDYIFNPGDESGVGDYIGRTESIKEGPNNENITLLITDAQFPHDDGLYYCFIHTLGGIMEDSNKIAVQVSGEKTCYVSLYICAICDLVQARGPLDNFWIILLQGVT